MLVCSGNSASIPMNPVLTGLITTAVCLTVIVCVVMVALYHRHKAKRHPREVKHNQLEMTEDANEDAMMAGINTPLNPGSVVGVIVGDHRSTEETDPDIIPNKYGKSQLHVASLSLVVSFART